MLKEHKVDYFLAHLYDHADRIKIVMAGSQVGLLEEFIGKNASSPLFGRAKTQIEMKRLSPENSLVFLIQGCAQANIRVDIEELKDAVNTFDGLIGWLTYYGYYRIRYGHEKAKELVFKDAEEIIRDEFLRFMSQQRGKKKRFLYVLKAIANGYNTWNEIKEFIKIKKRENISDSRLLNLLERLSDYSFIERDGNKYLLCDPIMEKFFRSSS